MDCNDLIINTSENVYVPAEDSYLIRDVVSEFIEKSDKTNLSVLDMGTGTGIIGICLATSIKIKKVILVDINPEAIALSKSNINKNRKFIKAELLVEKSDLFSSIELQNFDVITFNPPYLPDEKNEDLMKEAFYGGWSGIEVAERFLIESKNYINKNSSIFMVASSLSDLSSLKKFVEINSFKITDERKIHIFFEDIIVLKLELQK